MPGGGKPDPVVASTDSKQKPWKFIIIRYNINSTGAYTGLATNQLTTCCMDNALVR